MNERERGRERERGGDQGGGRGQGNKGLKWQGWRAAERKDWRERRGGPPARSEHCRQI